MASKSESTGKIKPVSDDELPPEFKRFDKPFGLQQHVFSFSYHVISHAGAAYFLFYLIPMGYVPLSGFLYWMIYGYMTGVGTTVGCHRYWTHRAFKANKPLQIMLMLMQTAAMQYPIFKWSRDHRVHHKYTDTNADPHNAARGFWFSHILWLYYPKHPDCEKALKIIDISDLARDPIVRFQSKYYWELVLVVFFIVPIGLCHLIFPEMTWVQLFTGNFARYTISLHFTFLVNSVAHISGDKPYDKYITATENKLVSLCAVGEGWHNYHHTFPWDYKAAEYGIYYNFSTLFIHFFAMVGWAYDLKSVSNNLLAERINRTGDGSHALHDHGHHNKQMLDAGDTSYSACWGWGDESLKKADLEITETRFPGKYCRG